MASPRFNYIVTIHNKEDMIEPVIQSLLMCCRAESRIYAVLDGCHDRSEAIIDEIIRKFVGVPIMKVHTADVHELLSINAGLRAADHSGEGFNIVLQDDVILADYRTEEKVTHLYQWGGPTLGYVSFRLGANFSSDACTSEAIVPLTDYTENVYGHGTASDHLYPGEFAFRDVPIKSPVCIPFYLLRKVGVLEERLAPYGHDDTEFSIRCLETGFLNGVFALRFYSDVKWGGTRVNAHPNISKTLGRNIGRIREWHGAALERLSARSAIKPTARLFPCVGTEREHAEAALELSQRTVQEWNRAQAPGLLSRVKRVARAICNSSR